MSRPVVLVFGSLNQVALTLLLQSLLDRDRCDVAFLEQERYPREIGLYWSVGGPGELIVDGLQIPLDSLTSVVVDGVNVPLENLTGLTEEDASYAQIECWSALISLFHELSRHCLVANHVTQREHLTSRWAELSLLSRAGLTVPQVLISSDPALAREFCQQPGRRVLARTLEGPKDVLHEIDEAFLERLSRAPRCPVHLEEAPPGPASRLVAVSERLFHLPDRAIAEVPEAIQAGCLEISRQLDLHLAEFPLVWTADGVVVTGLRSFLSPESFMDAGVVEAACELVETGECR